MNQDTSKKIPTFAEMRSALMGLMVKLKGEANDPILHDLVTALIDMDEKIAALNTIEEMASDDFVQDLDYDKEIRHVPFSEREEKLLNKLLAIYKLSHACSGHCRNPHEGWKTQKTCLSLDCPERTGGVCTAGERTGVVTHKYHPPVVL